MPQTSMFAKPAIDNKTPSSALYILHQVQGDPKQLLQISLIFEWLRVAFETYLNNLWAHKKDSFCIQGSKL